jgi:hypothetical protein
MRALVGNVWQKQTVSEARAHGSAKISGKALGVQQKWVPKNSKIGLPSQGVGIMKPMAGV